MKTPSFAVLVLLGLATPEEARAVSLKQMHREATSTNELPPDASLLQTEEQTTRHRRHHHRSYAQGDMYPETKPGRQWYELDNHHERLHGTVASDELSPYDPEVADAPEDMKRVGNDHEALHNAKLSPNGYYNGFHHKDYKGNYAQRALAQARKQNQRRSHRQSRKLDNFNVQLRDHENDTDDLVEQNDLIQQKDHDRDTDDIVEGDDSYVQTAQKGAWKSYFANQSSDQAAIQIQDKNNWDKMYAREEEDATFEGSQFVQTKDHENDTDSIPEGQDPLGFEDEENKPKQQILEQEDQEYVQLIPHENDTEDVLDLSQQEKEDVGYNTHHSKLWNQAVSEKAQAIEDEIKMQEQMKLAKKKAIEDEKLKKAEDQRKKVLAQKRREQNAKEKATHESQRTLDLSELYSNFVPLDKINLQTGYQQHTANWERMVSEEADRQENELNEFMDYQDPSNPHFFKTINPEEEYDGMLLQKDYQHHSDNWNNLVTKETDRMDEELSNAGELLDAKSDPSRPEFYSSQANKEQLYDGMLLQKEYQHHSNNWNNLIEKETDRMDEELSNAGEILDARSDPTRPEFYGSKVDKEDLYNGMLLQTGYQKHTANWDRMVSEEADRQENELNEFMDYQDPSNPHFFKTINPEEEYNGMLLQTGYQKHTANWERMVSEEADRQENELNEFMDYQDPSNPHFFKTINPEEEYDGMLLQKNYQHHSDNWNNLVTKETDRMDEELSNAGELLDAKSDPSRPEFYASQTNKAEMYDGMLLATDFYSKHSALWDKEVDQASDALEKQMNDVADEQDAKINSHRPEFYAAKQNEGLYDTMAVQLEGSGHSQAFEKIMKQEDADYEADELSQRLAQQKKEQEAKAQGFESAAQAEVVQPVYNYKNPSVNQEEMYAGVSLIQLQDHAEDYDDIVPELNDAPEVAHKQVQLEKKKTDFAGDSYTEVYEE